jgi:hypothetical protein
MTFFFVGVRHFKPIKFSSHYDEVDVCGSYQEYQFQLGAIPESTRLLQQAGNCEVIDGKQNSSQYVLIDALIGVIKKE